MVSEKTSAALSVFHPVVADWFQRQVGEPTLVQAQVWPRIAAGENVLVTAPTGSGKTLAAFLWSLNQLLTGEWRGGQTKVLYVSPLRALNNDIQRNLLAPLAQLTVELEGGWRAARGGTSADPQRRHAIRRATEDASTPSRGAHHHPGEPQHPADIEGWQIHSRIRGVRHPGRDPRCCRRQAGHPSDHCRGATRPAGGRVPAHRAFGDGPSSRAHRSLRGWVSARTSGGRRGARRATSVGNSHIARPKRSGTT